MADHLFEPEEVAGAYRYCGHWYRSLVGAIPDTAWDQPALGEWNVRELVAHTSRAFRTVVEYIDGEPKDPTEIATAAEYFRIVLAEETPHVHIAERARREAAAESDWVTALDQIVAEAMAIVDGSEPAVPVHLFVGEMPLSQYLATRVLEVVIHGIDLAAALDMPSTPPGPAMRVTLLVLADLAGEEHQVDMIRHLSGRAERLMPLNVLDRPPGPAGDR